MRFTEIQAAQREFLDCRHEAGRHRDRLQRQPEDRQSDLAVVDEMEALAELEFSRCELRGHCSSSTVQVLSLLSMYSITDLNGFWPRALRQK